MVRETDEPGMSVSLVARKHGINPNQLFQWRKLERAGALAAVGSGQAVVPATESGLRARPCCPGTAGEAGL
jgi:transposase